MPSMMQDSPLFLVSLGWNDSDLKALMLKAYNCLEYEEVPDPQIAPDEVLLCVKACGIWWW
jgi:hypothetical protein